jgi:hypothetical protein
MLYTLVEDSLKNIEGSNRFHLVHEAIKLAKSAPMDIDHKPVTWALKSIAENGPSTKEIPNTELPKH